MQRDFITTENSLGLNSRTLTVLYTDSSGHTAKAEFTQNYASRRLPVLSTVELALHIDNR